MTAGNTHSCIGAAKATHTTICTSIESKERQHMNVESMTHSLVLFIVNFEENRIRVRFSQLTDLIKWQLLVNKFHHNVPD